MRDPNIFRYFDPVVYDHHPDQKPQVFIVYPRLTAARLIERTEEALWNQVNDVLEAGLPPWTDWSIGFVETDHDHVQMTLYSFCAKNTEWWPWLTGVTQYEDGEPAREQFVRASHDMIVIGTEMRHRLDALTWEDYLSTRPELPGGLSFDEPWERLGGVWTPASKDATAKRSPYNDQPSLDLYVA